MRSSRTYFYMFIDIFHFPPMFRVFWGKSETIPHFIFLTIMLLKQQVTVRKVLISRSFSPRLDLAKVLKGTYVI